MQGGKLALLIVMKKRYKKVPYGTKHHEFSRKFAKKSSERRKTRKERRKKELKFPIFGPVDFSNSDSYRTIRSPM